jgi:hypothetical protein
MKRIAKQIKYWLRESVEDLVPGDYAVIALLSLTALVAFAIFAGWFN